VPKKLSQLDDTDLNKKVSIAIGFDQTEIGVLTDYYGSLGEDERAIVAVELDRNLTFFLPPNAKIEILS
jgi:hypothetical protein